MTESTQQAGPRDPADRPADPSTSSGPAAGETPGSGYDPTEVEAKWQERWERQGTNDADLDRGENPFYALMMFPYPSAEGLHVGNLFAFTGNDIYEIGRAHV